ncbi:hypothetical protein [Sinorhizobium fredii]|uniref:hypothetical protein n=1 Tax=Rhizobium fredii TaxID=380 RepID=UPI000CF2DFAB|nr:hypothetical protein [Sinorhizobium fredii]
MKPVLETANAVAAQVVRLIAGEKADPFWDRVVVAFTDGTAARDVKKAQVDGAAAKAQTRFEASALNEGEELQGMPHLSTRRTWPNRPMNPYQGA